jgi:hypothetical protein
LDFDVHKLYVYIEDGIFLRGSEWDVIDLGWQVDGHVHCYSRLFRIINLNNGSIAQKLVKVLY